MLLYKYMNEKMSIARKAYWATISKEERSKRNKANAILAWSKRSVEERKERSKLMLSKRYGKKS